MPGVLARTRRRSSCLLSLLFGWVEFPLEPGEVVGEGVAHPVVEFAEQLGFGVAVAVSGVGDLWWPVFWAAEPGALVGSPVEVADDGVAAALPGAQVCLSGAVGSVGLRLVEAGDEDREALRPPFEQGGGATVDQRLGRPVVPARVQWATVAGWQGQGRASSGPDGEGLGATSNRWNTYRPPSTKVVSTAGRVGLVGVEYREHRFSVLADRGEDSAAVDVGDLDRIHRLDRLGEVRFVGEFDDKYFAHGFSLVAWQDPHWSVLPQIGRGQDWQGWALAGTSAIGGLQLGVRLGDRATTHSRRAADLATRVDQRGVLQAPGLVVQRFVQNQTSLRQVAVRVGHGVLLEVGGRSRWIGDWGDIDWRQGVPDERGVGGAQMDGGAEPVGDDDDLVGTGVDGDVAVVRVHGSDLLGVERQGRAGSRARPRLMDAVALGGVGVLCHQHALDLDLGLGEPVTQDEGRLAAAVAEAHPAVDGVLVDRVHIGHLKVEFV